MSYPVVFIFSLSILIASVIGWVRFKRIDPAYYPFLYCLWIGSLNEIINYILAANHQTNALNNNIYALLESLLLLWLFKNWGNFDRAPRLFIALLILFPAVWIIDNFFISTVTRFTFYYRIFYSFILVLLSVHAINGLILTESKNILKNAIFLLCMGFVIYYTFSVLVQTFWLYGLNVSREFTIRVIFILLAINLFANLIYALAVLWMPTRRRFTLPY